MLSEDRRSHAVDRGSRSYPRKANCCVKNTTEKSWMDGWMIELGDPLKESTVELLITWSPSTQPITAVVFPVESASNRQRLYVELIFG